MAVVLPLPSNPQASLSTSCSSSAASTAATRAALAVRFAEREGEKAESKLREGESIEMGDKKEGGERCIAGRGRRELISVVFLLGYPLWDRDLHSVTSGFEEPT